MIYLNAKNTDDALFLPVSVNACVDYFGSSIHWTFEWKKGIKFSFQKVIGIRGVIFQKNLTTLFFAKSNEWLLGLTETWQLRFSKNASQLPHRTANSYLAYNHWKETWQLFFERTSNIVAKLIKRLLSNYVPHKTETALLPNQTKNTGTCNQAQLRNATQQLCPWKNTEWLPNRINNFHSI